MSLEVKRVCENVLPEKDEKSTLLLIKAQSLNTAKSKKLILTTTFWQWMFVKVQCEKLQLIKDLFEKSISLKIKPQTVSPIIFS